MTLSNLQHSSRTSISLVHQLTGPLSWQAKLGKAAHAIREPRGRILPDAAVKQKDTGQILCCSLQYTYG